MNGTTRVIMILLGIVVIGTTSAAVVFHRGKTDEHHERVAVEQTLQRVRHDKAALEQERDGLLTKQSELEGHVASLTSERDTLLTKVRSDEQLFQQVQADQDQQLEQVATLQQYLDAERQEKAALADRVAELQQALSEAESRLVSLEAERQQSSQQAQAPQSVELAPIVVQSTEDGGPSFPEARPLTEAPRPVAGSMIATIPQDGLQGQVLVVNRDFDFVVTSLGEDDPVEVGTVLEVYDQQHYVGRVQIERIYGAMSAATILAETNKDTLQEGQVVYAL